MNNYFLHGKLSAKAGDGEKLRAILLEAAASVSTVKGCIVYVIGKDPADTDAVWITEIWETKEDHGNSLKLESVKEIISRAMPLIGAPPQKGQELEIIGGKGV